MTSASEPIFSILSFVDAYLSLSYRLVGAWTVISTIKRVLVEACETPLSRFSGYIIDASHSPSLFRWGRHKFRLLAPGHSRGGRW